MNTIIGPLSPDDIWTLRREVGPSERAQNNLEAPVLNVVIDDKKRPPILPTRLPLSEIAEIGPHGKDPHRVWEFIRSMGT